MKPCAPENRFFLPLVVTTLLALPASFATAQTSQSTSTTTVTNAPAARPDPWAALRPFVGCWAGEATGEAGAGKCEREYTFVLNQRFLRVTNQTIYPAQDKNPKGETHADVGYFSHDRAARKFVLRQFHGEGFVNQYECAAEAAAAGQRVFVSTAIENIPAGWRARETYRFVNADELLETFELAEPGKEFTRYTETRLRRKKP